MVAQSLPVATAFDRQVFLNSEPDIRGLEGESPHTRGE